MNLNNLVNTIAYNNINNLNYPFLNPFNNNNTINIEDSNIPFLFNNNNKNNFLINNKFQQNKDNSNL